MTNAKRDQNRRPSLIGTDSTDSTALAVAEINPVTDNLKVESTNRSITATVGTVGKRDENRIRSAYGISSTDANVLVPLHVSPQGEILVEFV